MSVAALLLQPPRRAAPSPWAHVAVALQSALTEALRTEAMPAASRTDAAARSTTIVDRDALLISLFEQEAASLTRLARLFTDDRNAAEDLVQEAFVRLHSAVHRIEEPDRAAAYLRSIVLNLARDHNRRGLMKLRHFEAPTPTSNPDAPDDRVVLDDQQARVIAALGSLSGQQRECLVLRYYFELSEREIGDTLDISPNSVKTHCRRGLERLRLLLESAR
jgi:RNA polymerase sigma-70 factor (sigma-E family)